MWSVSLSKGRLEPYATDHLHATEEAKPADKLDMGSGD